MVLGLCRLLLRDPVEAEDAAQQVFLSAQRALLGGAVAREPPAWLAAIARNECRARIRARMREPLALPELPADLPDPLASAIRSADLAALWAALSELPRRQRKAFLLRELGGMSYGELGVALGVTRPAVESLLFRARRQLRNLLAAVNAALVPVAMRDQLARLLPDFGSTSGSAGTPIAAKVAAVTVGVGLGAAGVVELPRRHAHHAEAKPAPVVPAAVQSEGSSLVSEPTAAASPDVTLMAQERRHLRGVEDRHGRDRDDAELETETEADHEGEPIEHDTGDAPQASEPAEQLHASLTSEDGGHNGGSDSGGGGRSGSGDGEGHSALGGD